MGTGSHSGHLVSQGHSSGTGASGPLPCCPAPLVLCTHGGQEHVYSLPQHSELGTHRPVVAWAYKEPFQGAGVGIQR